MKNNIQGDDHVKETMSKKEYLIYTLLWNLIVCAWFRALLFSTVDGFTILQSHIVLGLLVVSVFCFDLVLDYFITGGKNRNWNSITAITLLAYGGYTFLVYARYFSWYKIIVLITLILSGLYTALVFGRKIKSTGRRKRKRILKLRFQKAYMGVRTVTSFAGMSFMIFLFIQTNFFGGLLTARPVQSTEIYAEEADKCDEEYGSEAFLESHRDYFLKLLPIAWEGCSPDEKMQVLQMVIEYQRKYLGIKKPLTLYASKMDDDMRAYYDYQNSFIQININHLCEDSSSDVVTSVLHECFHASQYQIAEIYESLGPENQNCFFLQNAAIYSRELKNYANGREHNYQEYYDQRLEKDARLYSSLTCQKIFTDISPEK